MSEAQRELAGFKMYASRWSFKPNLCILCEINSKLPVININCLWLQVPISMQTECSQPHSCKDCTCTINLLGRKSHLSAKDAAWFIVCASEQTLHCYCDLQKSRDGHKTGHKPRKPGAWESNSYRLILLIRSVLQNLPQLLITAQEDAHNHA